MMDFRSQDAGSKLDVSDTSSSSTYVPVSREGSYSPLPAFAERTTAQNNSVGAEHEDEDVDMDMDADRDTAIELNDAFKNANLRDASPPMPMDPDQKHIRPSKSAKTRSQQSSTQTVNVDDNIDSQGFFASRASFWAMVAAHGLPSTCGPPEGMFELGEETGGAWRCVSNPFSISLHRASLPPFFLRFRYLEV